MDFTKNESGNVLVLTAMCMTVVMGFAGMALDVGLAYRVRQRVQSAADAGAIAGAVSALAGGSATTAANASALQNGYPSGDVTVSTVSFGGQSGYTQVTVTTPNPTAFMRVFGFNSLNVSATAVAGPALPGSGCVDLTQTTGTDFTFSGSNAIQANCGVEVSSTGSKAVDVKDCGGTTKTTYKYLEIAGGINEHGGCNFPAVTGVSPSPNEWGTNDLTGAVPPGDCTSTFPSSGTSPITITGTNVSTYSGGTSNGVVCFTTAVTLGGGAGDTFTMPGSGAGVVYVFENGVTIGGNSNVQFGTGSCSGTPPVCSTSLGAMMEITGGAFNTPGSASTLSIYAPTQQPGTANYDTYLNGIAILQPYTNTSTLNLVFGSTSTLNLDGYVYAPTADLYMHDQGGGVLAAGLVVGYIDSSSNSTVTIYSYDQANASTTLNRVVALVE